jgi:hypothetical protein
MKRESLDLFQIKDLLVILVCNRFFKFFLAFMHVADFCEGINNIQLQILLDGELEWNSEYGEFYLYMK